MGKRSTTDKRQSLSRRQILEMLTAGAVVGLLSGCGGGGAGRQADTILKPDVVVIPDDGSTIIESVSETSMTVSGDTSAIEIGRVVASAQQGGVLRRVTGLIPNGAETIVETTQATLDDALVQTQTTFDKTLAFEDYSIIEPLVEGVTVGPSSNAPHGRSSGGSLRIRLDNVRVSDDTEIFLDGEVDVDLGLQLPFEYSATNGLEYVKFQASLGISGDMRVGGRGTLIEYKRKFLRSVGTPIVVFAGPLPVVFVPVTNYYFVVNGSVEVAAATGPSGSLVLTGGLEYSRARGWRPISDLANTLYMPPSTSFYGEFTCGVTFIRPETTLLLYGIVGPYVSTDAPRLEVGVRAESQPQGVRVTGDAVFAGSGGFRAEILGVDLADVDFPNLLEFEVSLYDRFYPSDGSIDVIID